MAEVQLYKCKLKAGVHVGRDLTKEPVKGVYPEVEVKRGGVYYSDTDLAEKDPNRWEAVGEKRERSRVAVTVGASLGEENGFTGDAPAPPPAKGDRKKGDEETMELEQLTKSELLEEAGRRNVKADERMTKAQIIDAMKAGPQDDGE